jgi:uncharacterized protein with PIN domain
MKRCGRCNFASPLVIRESVTRRGRHEYAMRWYRCPQCNEVSLSYRRVRDLVPSATTFGEDRESGTENPWFSPIDGEPVYSR